MIRGFLAVVPDAGLLGRLTLAQQDLKQRLMQELPRTVRLSWVRPASIHLTMKFLGDIPDDLVPVLREAMTQAMSGHRALSIPLERVGVFPDVRRPRVLWIGPAESWKHTEDSRRLAVIHQEIETCCRTANLAPDARVLTPHLTLARVREGDRQLVPIVAGCGTSDDPLGLGPLAINSIILMRSDLHPTGSVYTPLWDVRLGP